MSVKDEADQVKLAETKTASYFQERPKTVAFSVRPDGTVPIGPAMFAPTEVNDMIKVGKDRFSNDLIKGVAQLQVEKTKATLDLVDVAQQGFRTMILGVSATAVIGIFIALVLALKLPRSLLRLIGELAAIVEKISMGLTNVSASRVGLLEFQGLAKAIERMRMAQEAMLSRLRSR